MNQFIHRVVASLRIDFQQRLQNCDFMQSDISRLKVQRAPAIAQVIQHRWRQVLAVVECRVLFQAVLVLLHVGESKFRRSAVVMSLKWLGFSVDFRAGGGVT
jgi:hypothetical protein